jgi:hypothetical protein
MAEEMGQLTADMLRTGLGWWLTTESIQLSRTGVVDSTVAPLRITASLQGTCLFIGQVMALLLVFIAAIKTMIQRKGVHLMQALQGLIINALVCAMGVAVIDSLLLASDTLAKGILAIGFGGKTDAEITEHIAQVMVSTGWSPMMLLVLAMVGFIVGLAQLCMVFLRQAAIPIQALLLPLAGAGQLGGERARAWLPRLYTSIFTVIAYKPAAALIISVGFVELADGAQLLDWIRGIVTLLLSTLGLRALMGLFAPLGMSLAGATSGGGFLPALMNAAGGLGMHRGGVGGSGGMSAVQHAQQMAKTGPAAAYPAAAAAATVLQLGKAALDSASAAMSGQDGPGESPPPADGGGPQGPTPAPPARPDGQQGSPPPPASPTPGGGGQPDVGPPAPPPSPAAPAAAPGGVPGEGGRSPAPSPPAPASTPAGPRIPAATRPAGPSPGVAPTSGAGSAPAAAAAPGPPVVAGPGPPAEVATTVPGDEAAPTGAAAWTQFSRPTGPPPGPPPNDWPGERQT